MGEETGLPDASDREPLYVTTVNLQGHDSRRIGKWGTAAWVTTPPELDPVQKEPVTMEG